MVIYILGGILGGILGVFWGVFGEVFWGVFWGYFPFGYRDKTVPSATHFELTRQTVMKIIHIQNNIKTDSETRLFLF